MGVWRIARAEGAPDETNLTITPLLHARVRPVQAALRDGIPATDRGHM